MKTYPLHGPPMPFPPWFTKVQHGQHDATVQKNGTVVLEGESLRFAPSDALPAGTAVRVWLNRYFVCAMAEDLEHEQAARAAQEKAREDAWRRQQDQRRVEAESFNAGIKLPAAWDVGIKDVLSGLSESSWGNGRNRVTVQHILLLEDLRAGRIFRKAQSFLCSSSPKQDGKRWADQPIERHADGRGQSYAPKVTCKACLRIASRF